MIADYKKTPRQRWAGAMMLLGVLACLVLTNAYVAKADLTFGEPVNLKSVIPVIDPAYDSIDCFSSDGQEIYIESDNRPGGYGDFDIWVVKRTTLDSDWDPPTNIGPMVNSSKGEAHASISGDGLVLCFISDRPGGYGAFDIYMTIRTTKNDPWGLPFNLGPNVNSSSVEAAPWISADGLELTFSSWRPGGYGGADIYVTKRATINDPWCEPVNVGPEVNSSYNEYDISLSPDGLLLFFDDPENVRPGGYGDGDIWMARRPSFSAPWQPPVNLGPGINSSLMEAMPRISPDGHTLYFITLGGEIYDNWQALILPIVDFNGDGNIDTDDLVILVNCWGTNNSLCDIGPTPLGDGIVDMKDLEVFMSYWEKENMPEAPEEEQ